MINFILKTISVKEMKKSEITNFKTFSTPFNFQLGKRKISVFFFSQTIAKYIIIISQIYVCISIIYMQNETKKIEN